MSSRSHHPKNLLVATFMMLTPARWQADRERRNERRNRDVEEIGSGKLVMLYFADLIGARCVGRYGGMSSAAASFASSSCSSSRQSFTGGPPLGFATRTGLDFVDFGTGTGGELHGPEAVLTRGQGMDLAEMLRGSVSKGFSAAAQSFGGGQDGEHLAEQRRLEGLLERLSSDLHATTPAVARTAAKHAAQTSVRG